jgi:hypothetical protein
LQQLRHTHAHGKEPKLIQEQQFGVFTSRLLAVVHVVSHQFVERPGVERVLIRLERDEIVRAEVVETIRQRKRNRLRIAPDDHHIQQLDMPGEVHLQFHLGGGGP